MTTLYPPFYSQQQSLIAYVQKDEPRKLNELLQERAFGVEDLGRALREASDKGHAECARVLLEHDAGPNMHDAKGFTPLIMAARKGHSHIIKLLVTFKANVNKPTYRIRATALHWAATNGHYGAVRALVGEGANVESHTVHSRTPLMLAARSDQAEIVDVLINAGSKVNARDYERATALHIAAEEGALDCVETLLRAGSEVNSQTRTGDTPIIKAARGGHPDVLRMLCRRGGDVMMRGRCMSAAHWAAEGGSVECMQLFLKQGLDPNQVTEDSYCGADFLVSSGVTPLMLAARGGYTKLIELLIKAGATVDLIDEDGRSALMYSVHSNYPKCVTSLIQHGADVDGVPIPPDRDDDTTDNDAMQSSRGLSPLFLAIKRNAFEILFILLRANCSVAIIGQTAAGDPVGPLEYALSMKKKASIYALLIVGAGRTVINPLFMQNSLLSLMKKDEQTAFHIMHILAAPPTLRESCRFVIRDVIGRRMTSCASELPLPPALQRYLNFDEFETLVEAFA